VGQCKSAVLFGNEWGLAGYCPGPAIASLGFGNTEALWMIPSVLVGVALQRWLDGWRQASKYKINPTL